MVMEWILATDSRRRGTPCTPPDGHPTADMRPPLVFNLHILSKQIIYIEVK